MFATYIYLLTIYVVLKLPRAKNLVTCKFIPHRLVENKKHPSRKTIVSGT